MNNNFPYKTGYTGELNSFSPRIAADLVRLVWQLKPELAGSVTEKRIASRRGDRRFRQIIAVEERGGQAAIVGTANISLLEQSYSPDRHVTEAPCLWLGSFVVDESVRGKGVAVRLWEKVLEVGRAENRRCLQFTSRPARAAAHRFYEKMGAVQIGSAVGVQFTAHENDAVTTPLPVFEENFELATGLMSLVFSEPDAAPVSEATARSVMAAARAERFEQLIPVEDGAAEATTIVFSVSF